jgi:hypothetical protein
MVCVESFTDDDAREEFKEFGEKLSLARVISLNVSGNVNCLESCVSDVCRSQ